MTRRAWSSPRIRRRRPSWQVSQLVRTHRQPTPRRRAQEEVRRLVSVMFFGAYGPVLTHTSQRCRLDASVLSYRRWSSSPRPRCRARRRPGRRRTWLHPLVSRSKSRVFYSFDSEAGSGTKSAKQTQGVAKPPEKKTFLRLEDSDEENEDDDEEAGEGDEDEVEDEDEEGSGQGGEPLVCLTTHTDD